MNLYGIESEGELLSGCFSKLHSRLGREKVEIADIVSRILAKIRENFRKKFFEEFDLAGDDRGSSEPISKELQQKASAWYYVAYSHLRVGKESENSSEDPIPQFLSFPWLVDDVMLSIRLSKAYEEQDSQSVVTSISDSVIKLFDYERDSLVQGFHDRIQKKSVISRSLQLSLPGVTLAMFGSSATFLFRQDSDLDLCVIYPTHIALRQKLGRNDQITVLKTLLPVLSNLFKHARLVDNARVPVSVHSYN